MLVIYWFFSYNRVYRPSGVIGSRNRLKIDRRKACGFDSHLGHPHFNFAPLAQLVEQIPLKDKVEGSIPSGRTCIKNAHAGVAELVYALVLGTSAARLEGSSPSSSTLDFYIHICYTYGI